MSSAVGVEAALAACRLAHAAAGMLLWGAFGFLATLVPPALRPTLERRLDAPRVCAVVLAALATALRLPLDAAAIGGTWGDAVDTTTLAAVVMNTAAGRAWQTAAVLAAVLVATLLPAARPGATPATAAAAGLLLAALALTGHAAMHEGWVGGLHRFGDAVHVLAGGAWLGALVPVLLLLGEIDRPPHRRDAVLALRRFSAAGHAAVALTIATGILNTALVLGRWPADWSSPYQALLCAKIGLVGVMTGLAIVNRYRLVPMLPRRSDGAAAIRRNTAVSLVLGVAAMACVSLFGLLEPA